jgi:hypothetical protein
MKPIQYLGGPLSTYITDPSHHTPPAACFTAGVIHIHRLSTPAVLTWTEPGPAGPPDSRALKPSFTFGDHYEGIQAPWARPQW